MGNWKFTKIPTEGRSVTSENHIIKEENVISFSFSRTKIEDVYTKIDLKTYGGTGYSFILEKFVPFLRNRGVSEKHIKMLLVDNPRSVLAFAAPK